MGIGTAFMAHLALPGSELRVGIDFARDAVVTAAVAAREPPYLLFPGPGALDVRALPPGRLHTLLVLDGTWSQARTLLHANPALAALPRVAFAPRSPSDYRIRRQPADFCVSTIEALAEVLAVLEPDGARFERLLDPFRAMVTRQEWFETEVRSNRHLSRKLRFPAVARRPSLAVRLAREWPRLVCMQGEANAWPIEDAERHPPETVHFVACRPSTGELYEAVIAPRKPLVASTPAYLEVSAERLLAGVSVAEWLRSWQAFARETDLLVHWGRFHVGLAQSEGLALPAEVIDLRSALGAQRTGSLEETAARYATSLTIDLPGRAGRRLAALANLVRALREAQ